MPHMICQYPLAFFVKFFASPFPVPIATISLSFFQTLFLIKKTTSPHGKIAFFFGLNAIRRRGRDALSESNSVVFATKADRDL